MKQKPVKLSKDIDAINHPVQPKKQVVKVAKPVRPPKRRKRRDYDDILDEFWL